MRTADLHIHTHFSDGTYSPEELVLHAARVELNAVAVTDHDTVEGCVRTAEACRSAGIEFLPGIELTAELGGFELHILGYCMDISSPRLLVEIARFQTVRQNRIREMVDRLNQLRIPLKAESVFALANCRSPGRPHVARALVKAGLCSSLDEAFERFLKRNRPAWVPKHKMSTEEAIRLIQEAGGVAVLAHPGLSRADPMIASLADCGLDGLECYHVKHSPGDCEHYSALAKQYHLLRTGGSDCHGYNKSRPLIGTVRVPWELVEGLRARASERQTANARPLSAS